MNNNRSSARKVSASACTLLRGEADRSGSMLLHGNYNRVLFSVALVMLASRGAFLARILKMWTALANAVHDCEARFQLLAEAIPQIVWTAVLGGGIDHVNRRWHQLTGLSSHQTLGWGWQSGLHPDDRPIAMRIGRRPTAPASHLGGL
jgi:PAS domain-containing protein